MENTFKNYLMNEAVTLGAFTKLVKTRSDAKQVLNDFDRNNMQGKDMDQIEYDKYHQAQKVIKDTEKELDKLPKVPASYWIGSRQYREIVYKIGKSYFTLSFIKLKKSNGLVEIDEITDKHKQEMLDDLYYY